MNKVDISMLKDKLICDFANFWMLDVVEKYLQIAKDNHFKNSFLCKYLNAAIDFVKETFDIKNEMVINQIRPMSLAETKLIDQDLNQYPIFKDLFEQLNFVYNVIKNEDLQYKIFELICDEHIANNVKPNELKINVENYRNENNFFNMRSSFLHDWPVKEIR